MLTIKLAVRRLPCSFDVLSSCTTNVLFQKGERFQKSPEAPFRSIYEHTEKEFARYVGFVSSTHTTGEFSFGGHVPSTEERKHLHSPTLVQF